MFTQLLTGPKNEAEAVQVALAGTAFERVRLAMRAGLALALDPNDTQQVFYLAIAVDGETLPRVAMRLAADPAGRELLRARAAIDSKHVDFAALRALPADTLGGAYVRALDSNGLDPDIFQRPPGLPEEFAYVAQRARQTHDLLHVLTGLDTDIPGEVALQAFTHAQLGQNFSKLIVSFGLAIFGLRYPRMWNMVKRATKAGEDAKFLLAVRWEDWWADPLSEVRARVGMPVLGVCEA
jgi:ubiquinone biosynthesis protein COQ4